MKLLVLSLFVAFAPLFCDADIRPKKVPPYLFLLPKRVTIGRGLDVALMVSPVTYDLKILFLVESKVAYISHLAPGKTKKITISASHFNPRKYSYKITVEAYAIYSDSLLFNKTVTVYKAYRSYKSAPAAIYVQRDKPFYRPRDNIRFCCFGVNDEFMIIKNPMDIYILDPNDSVMKVWFNQTNPTGVISQNFRLSPLPLLGTWKIMLQQHGTGLKHQDRFPVGEYSLPRMIITLAGDKYISHLGLPAFYLAERYIDIHVYAKYGFGAAVEGKCILKITVSGMQMISYQKVLDINGQVSHRFYLKEFFSHQCEGYMNNYASINAYFHLVVVATVVELQTNYETSSNPMTVSITDAPIQIIAPYNFYYKEGLCNELTITIKRTDGKQLTWLDVRNTLRIEFSRSSNMPSLITYLPIPISGRVNIKMPREPYSKMSIYYYGLYQNCRYTRRKTVDINKFQGPPHASMEAVLMGTVCYAGDEIVIRVMSTVQLKMVYHTVLQDNTILMQGEQSAFDYFKIVKIQSSQTWIPSVKIIITCFTMNGLLLIDVVVINLRTEFNYQINGIYRPGVNEAGKLTTLNVATAPHSTVYVMAIDKRLEALKKPNYISKESILSRLNGGYSKNVPAYIGSQSGLLQWAGAAWVSNRIGTGFPRPIPMRMRTMSSSGPTSSSSSKVRAREDFSEVWLWEEVKAGNDGLATITKKTPDSITTWPTHIFAVHPVQGISVMEEKLQFISFQKWFLEIDLPISVYRREVFFQAVRVYNGLQTLESAKIVMQSDHLLFNDGPVKYTMVGARKFSTVFYNMRSKVIGEIKVVVDLYMLVGKRYQLSDRIIKKLTVKPEGTTLYFNNWYPIDLTSGSYKDLISIDIPSQNVVPGSIAITASVTGDIMGPSIAGLGNLVRLPTGCGEQNMVFLSTNVNVFNYLKSRNALSPVLAAKIHLFTQSGYLNQMRYQLRDNGYSAFSSDEVSSTWLSSFVAKTFQLIINGKMKVYIDQKKLNLTLNFILSKQVKSGRFTEDGRVIHRGMQGGASMGIPMTAYVTAVLTLLKNYHPAKVEVAIKKAVAFLKGRNLRQLDTYTLCILFNTYVLVDEKVEAEKVEAIIETKAVSKGKYKYIPGEYDVEQTAYVLHGYAILKERLKGVKLNAWLLSKQNSNGGYSNTQATAVALEALTAYGLLVQHTTRASISIRRFSFFHSFPDITQDNLYTVYKKKCPSRIRKLKVKGRGDGIVYMSLSVRYNVYVVKKEEFGMAVTVKSTNHRYLIITICFRWKRKGNSGMFTSSMNAPSGYAPKSIACTKRDCEKYNSCTARDACLSDKTFKNGRIDLYLNEMYYNKSVYVMIILRRVHMVNNKDATMYIKTVDSYTGKSMITSLMPFHGKSKRPTWMHSPPTKKMHSN